MIVIRDAAHAAMVCAWLKRGERMRLGSCDASALCEVTPRNLTAPVSASGKDAPGCAGGADTPGASANPRGEIGRVGE